MQAKLIRLFVICSIFSSTYAFTQIAKHGTVVEKQLTSTILKDNRIDLNPQRNIKVYLPPNYNNSEKAYPVVYYLHSIFETPEKALENNLIELIEKGISNEVVPEFIFVIADYSSPTVGSLYENSSTSGRWLDFTIEELVPFIDNHFRTLQNKNSRAIAGDFMGGRGALKLAMVYPDVFSLVYALHPVATGTGYLPINSISIDWRKIHQAKSFDELEGQIRTQIFLAICQAFLPNPNRPPFYCDFLMDIEEETLELNPINVRREQAEFHLDETLDEFAENLRNLRAIAFDWGRFDPTQAHVISNRRFSKKLADLGITHEGEEYTGKPWDENWKENGRFYNRLLPFLARNLVFEDIQ